MSKVILGSMFFIALSLSASSAAAEQATLQVRNGPKYSGELLEYVPGDHVTLGVGPGKALRFATSDLVSFEIGAPAEARPAPKHAPAAPPKANPPAPAAPLQPPAAEPPARKKTKAQTESATASAAPSELVRAAAVHALLDERADWLGRDTNLAAPVLFTLVGVIATGVGIGLQVAYHNSDRELLPRPSNGPTMHEKDAELNAASLMTFVTGGVLLGSGFALWISRTSDARRTRELERIDAQLQGYGIQASVSPWVQPSAGSARGLAAGLNLHMTL